MNVMVVTASKEKLLWEIAKERDEIFKRLFNTNKDIRIPYEAGIFEVCIHRNAQYLSWLLDRASCADLIVFSNGWQDEKWCVMLERNVKELGIECMYDTQQDTLF